ncbi:MAG: hypothetical protein AB7H92_03675 [Microbacteriaceae bacterium]
MSPTSTVRRVTAPPRWRSWATICSVSPLEAHGAEVQHDGRLRRVPAL